MPSHWQLPGDELDIAGWSGDEEHPFFPEGSRDKRLLRCRDPAPRSWLVAGHRYLFKKSRSIYPEQFWAEVVASRLCRITGVAVPPAYAAWDSRDNTCAALIEWFYGYPGHPVLSFHLGGVYMKDMIENFDHKKGAQHNFGTIYEVCQRLSINMPLRYVKDWLSIWSRTLTFDALIGNTDRHQENWGFVLIRTPRGLGRRCELSPAFDNGTSLGMERPPEHFARFEEPDYLDK